MCVGPSTSDDVLNSVSFFHSFILLAGEGRRGEAKRREGRGQEGRKRRSNVRCVPGRALCGVWCVDACNIHLQLHIYIYI